MPRANEEWVGPGTRPDTTPRNETPYSFLLAATGGNLAGGWRETFSISLCDTAGTAV